MEAIEVAVLLKRVKAACEAARAIRGDSMEQQSVEMERQLERQEAAYRRRSSARLLSEPLPEH